MKKLIRLTVLIAVIMGSLIGTYLAPVNAQVLQEPTGLQNVRVWIDPEYDRAQQLLVMIEGQITGASAPALVKFLVPATAEMFSAGSKDFQGNYVNPYGAPSRVASSIPGWDEISFQVDYSTFRMEYYDAFAISGQTDKTISVDLNWLYPVSNLSISIQEPTSSTNYSVSPEGAIGKDGDGLTIHTYSYASWTTTDEPLHFDIAYTRTEQNPSILNPAIQSSPNSGGSPNYTLIILSIIVVVVVGGAIWIIRSMRKTAVPVRSSYAANRPSRKGGSVPARTSTRNRQTARMVSGSRAANPESVPPPKEPETPGKKVTVCRGCGEKIDGNARSCPYCGESIRG